MSVLIAVNKSNRVEIMTDAAFVNAEDGIVSHLGPKHFIGPRCVIASFGWFPAAAIFNILALERCKNFDGVISCADDLWPEAIERTGEAALQAKAKLPPDTVFGLVIAGWSDERAQLELREIDSAENALSEDLAALAVGPTNEAGEATQLFTKRFSRAPDTFDAQQVGLGFMNLMRSHPRRFADGSLRPCVGGHVYAMIIEAQTADFTILHRWPGDTVGQPIREAA